MSDADVRVLQARLDATNDRIDRALSLLDGNGKGAMAARIGYLERAYKSRLVAEAEGRERAKEDRAAKDLAAEMAAWKRYTMAFGWVVGFLAGAYELLRFFQAMTGG